MSKKQKTLFESWNQCSSKSNLSNQGTLKKSETNNLPSNVSVYNSPSHNAFQPNLFARPGPSQLADNGFDAEAGKTWIYPTNYPVRDYQFSIVQEGLFKNTLVILPTGLGKTFIAAVIMYNIYRWYPKGKVVFMAPTRPLVAQQIDACYKVTGISPADTTQMTGTNMPEERKRMWAKKRVFFLTPQVFVNDLVRNICTADSIKCVVVDEAHKALGNHAYCQVIRELQSRTNQFRILALTATPGSDTQAVKTVLTNLLISHVELRSEDSDDVKQYTHTRDIEKIVVPLGDRLLSIKSRFLDVINIYLKRLTQRKAMSSKNPSSLSKYQVLKIREEFSQHPPNNINKFDYGLALADFSLCISLYHAYELLMLHGARPFHNFLKGILNGDKSIPHARAELLKNFDFEELFKEVEENYVTESVSSCPNIKMGANGTRVLPGHPKLEKLLEIVLQHFRTVNRDSVTSTRVMIFSQYRDSVDEIVEMLNHHQPMIKVMSFIGQASKSATSVGYSQKHQLKVIQDFRDGGYNTLVSTCVGEEGLDIGEVDLIVCYDCPKSPIRLVQRMGRTGRLRKGRIVILVTEGKEEQMYNSCESKKKAIHRAISKGSAFTQLFHNSPSLIPPGKVKPVCVKTIVSVEPPKPFFKLKGKAQESAFLSEAELMEFNCNFKVPKSEFPLLAQSNFVSFKNEEQVQNESSAENPDSVEPRLSLSKWVLWQTTPQRTHIVSHSSKSLLLIETSEKINFPCAINRPSAQQRAPEATIQSISNTVSTDNINQVSTSNLNPPVIDLCSDDDLYDFGELQDIENETIALLNEDQNINNLNLSRDTSANEKSNSFLFPKKLLDPVTSLANIREGNLFKKLFGIDSMKLPFNASNCILKPPPAISSIIKFESISEVSTEPEPYVEPKNCILRILNNKMKARLKRKSKELGIKLSFYFDSEKLDSSIKENITFNSSLAMHPIENVPVFDASSQSFTQLEHSKPNSDVNQALIPKGIAFDLDVDIPQVFEKFSDEMDNLPPSSPNCRKPECDSLTKDEKQQDEYCSMDADSSLIFEQFFSNQDDDIADKLEASFCAPLMIKKVVFERDSVSTQSVQKEVSVIKNQSFNANKSNMDGINRKLHESKMAEPTQYSLTQLVSLIDNTEQLDGNKNLTKHIETRDDVTNNKSDENISSDEEIEPTPPREIIPVATKFCYRMNSANLDSEAPQKESGTVSELQKSPVSLNSKVSFDLSFTPTNTCQKAGTKNLENIFPSKVNPLFKSNSNSVPGIANTKPVNLPAGISFDLSDVHSSPKNISNNPKVTIAKLEKYSEANTFNETLLQNDMKQTMPTSPAKLNSRISFDLSDVQFSPFEKVKDDAGVHTEVQDSCNTVNSLEDSEPNVLNCRIASSQSKFDTSISFDLSDVRFSPIEKCSNKGILKSSSNDIARANPTNMNPNVSFDLSDAQFTHCNEDEGDTATVTGFQNQDKLITASVHLDETPKKSSKGNPVALNTCVSFDLSEVEFSPHQKSNEEVFDSKVEGNKEKNSVGKVDHSTSFESPTLDKVFFDISFDFPELNSDPLLKAAESVNDKVNIVSEKFDSVQVKPLDVTTHVNSLSTAQTSFKKLTSDLNSAELEDLNLSISHFQYEDEELVKSKDLLPQQSNQNVDTVLNLGLKHISDSEANLNTIQKSPESPKMFAVRKKRKRANVLDDTTLISSSLHNNELDDFIQSASKPNTDKTVCHNKKSKQKRRNKNNFLLTQAVVSGSESSGDEIDEDEDGMDESFINDNTVVESPLNQRAMYLQSVKNIVGLPQKFKLKERSNYNEEIYSQPADEGCSYLLDSFCVDDNEVILTSSEDEYEENCKENDLKSKKKRKRIVALSDSSSSEEEFVKKIKSQEDEFVQKLTPESNSFAFAGGSKVSKKSNIISPIRHIGKPKDREATFSRKNSELSNTPSLKMPNKYQTSNILSKDTKNDFDDFKKQFSSGRERVAKSCSKDQQKNVITKVSKQNDDLLNLDSYENFAFDVGWDDIDPVPPFFNSEAHIASNSSKSNDTTYATEVQNNAVASTVSSSYVNQSHATGTDETFATDVNSRKCSTQIISCLNLTSSSPPNSSPIIKTILVDSRELASGKPVISFLRNKHGVNPFVMQLVSADYILSNKVAIERILDSDFPSFGLPMRLVEKVRAMSELYEKPFVIIEKDSRKRAMGFNKLSTKYLQFAVCANFHLTVNVLYSNSAEDTASIIYDIIEKERKKGLQIDVPVDLNLSSQKLYEFYLSFPKVSPICAFNFVYNFPSINLVFKSSVDQLKKAGFISTRKANAVFNYLRSELLLDSFS